jgi:hypothetical protein
LGGGGQGGEVAGEEHVAGRWDKALTQLVRYINKKDDILFTKKNYFKNYTNLVYIGLLFPA